MCIEVDGSGIAAADDQFQWKFVCSEIVKVCTVVHF